MSENKTQISTNVIWRLAERFGAQGVSFVVSVVLARLIAPEVYGTIALITVLTNILNVFVQSGLSTAIIQKRDSDDLDMATVFTFNIVMSIVLYAILFAVSPLISDFYDKPDMTPVIRVMSVTILLGGINGIQQAYVSKRMQFKLFFKATIVGTIISAFIGIAMAYAGFGVWALVAQILSNQLMDTIILWCTIGWHPHIAFSFERFKPLYSFSWKVFVSNLIDTIYKNLRSLLIGKIYTESDLAFYNRGNHLPELVITNVNTSIQSVFFPAYASVSNDKVKLKELVRKSISSSTYIIFPCMAGLAAISNTLILVLYTDVWAAAVPYMWIACFSYAFWPMHTANLQVIQAMGRSDISLKLEIIKKTVTFICLIVSIRFGVLAVAMCAVPLAVFSLIVNAFPNRKLLDYSIKEQLIDIMPTIVMSLIMGVCVVLTGLLPLPLIVKLFVQIIMGASVYIVCSKLTHNSNYSYFKAKIKHIFSHKTNQEKK